MTDLFRTTSGPRDAKIAIVGESHGEDEDRQQQPFVGRSGQELNKILSECGLDRDAIFCTNVVPEQPYNNDMWRFFHPTVEGRKFGHPEVRGLYPKENVLAGLNRLYSQLDEVQPELIIGFGNYALWALTDDCFSVGDNEKRKVPTGIINWRGSQIYTRHSLGSVPLLPTIHPAAIFNTWPWRYSIKHDLSRRLPKIFNGGWQEPDRNFIIAPSYDQVREYLGELLIHLNAEPIDLSVDLETRNRHIACCSFAWEGSSWDAISIPFMEATNPEGYWPEEQEVPIVKVICDILTHPNCHIVGQNFLYDAQYIARDWGVIVLCAFDTMLMHHVCWPGTPMSLLYLSSLYCYHHHNWKTEGSIEDDKEWGIDVPEEQLWHYNCLDAVKALEVKVELKKLIIQLGLEFQAETQMAQFAMLLDVQLRGTLINTTMRAQTSMDLADAVESRREWLTEVVPEDVMPISKTAKHWTGSPMQQAVLFYDILGIRPPRGRSMNDDALERVAKMNPILQPVVQAIQELRSLRTFNSNFCKAPLDKDNRLRCSYNPTAKTFRYKSRHNAFGTGTNLQNIPEGHEDE